MSARSSQCSAHGSARSARSQPSGRSNRSASVPSARNALHQGGTGSGRMVPMIRCDKGVSHQREAIPGYRGFIPGKAAETMGEGLFSHVLNESRQPRLGHDEQANLRDKRLRQDALNWQLSMRDQVQPSPKPRDNKRGEDDMMTGFVPSAGDYRESRVPDSYEVYYEEPPLDNALKAKTNTVGYGGYVPGREAENVYGNTWTKTNMNATSAFYRTYQGRNRGGRSDPLAIRAENSRLYPRGFYDGQQNRGMQTLLTKERTAVERVESDNFREIPMHSSSYQDVRRGWSLDPWVGKQVDPAGRLAPYTRQEGYGCIPAPIPLAAPGYTGYVPGKVPENVCAERTSMEAAIARHRVKKNRAEQLQR